MKINQVEFITSAVRIEQYPLNPIPDIAFAGRSNVGKSSTINRLIGRKNLARTSSKPGKTATINFYKVEEKLFLVDLPGYGYARVSKEEKKKWRSMIEEYLKQRESLYMVILLVDARHQPTEEDCMMFDWIKSCQGNAMVIATKWDKLKPKEHDGQTLLIKNTLRFDEDDLLIPFSAETGQGKEEVWHIIKEILEQ